MEKGELGAAPDRDGERMIKGSFRRLRKVRGVKHEVDAPFARVEEKTHERPVQRGKYSLPEQYPQAAHPVIHRGLAVAWPASDLLASTRNAPVSDTATSSGSEDLTTDTSMNPRQTTPQRAVSTGRSILVLAGVIGGAGGTTGIAAQDSHYWSEKFGTRATLLGGAVIGSIRDLSATYYNPGALALDQDPGFLLSARAFRTGTFTFEDGGGDGVDLASTSTRPVPTMLAGAIRIDALGDHQLAYSLLLRNQFKTEISTNIIEDRPAAGGGTDQIAAGFGGGVTLLETWAGLSWSFPAGDGIGVGLTQYLAIREQSAVSRLVAQRAGPAGDVAVATTSRRRSYKDYRLLTKVGVAADFGNVDIGLNVTTPSVGFAGSGLALFNASAAGDLDGDGSNDSYLASNVQPDLPSTFETSWAIGAGLAVQLSETRLHGTAEWYHATGPFKILDAEAFTPQTGGDAIDNDATGRYASVLDWGVGVEHRVGRVTTVYGSYSLDRSAAPSDAADDADFILTRYDITRYSLGSSFRIGGSDLMLGLAWARGFDDLQRLFDGDNPNLPGDVFPGDGDIGLRFTEWTIVLGFELRTGG
jgi:hypothetical protein